MILDVWMNGDPENEGGQTDTNILAWHRVPVYFFKEKKKQKSRRELKVSIIGVLVPIPVTRWRRYGRQRGSCADSDFS